MRCGHDGVGEGESKGEGGGGPKGVPCVFEDSVRVMGDVEGVQVLGGRVLGEGGSFRR